MDDLRQPSPNVPRCPDGQHDFPITNLRTGESAGLCWKCGANAGSFNVGTDSLVQLQPSPNVDGPITRAKLCTMTLTEIETHIDFLETRWRQSRERIALPRGTSGITEFGAELQAAFDRGAQLAACREATPEGDYKQQLDSAIALVEAQREELTELRRTIENLRHPCAED